MTEPPDELKSKSAQFNNKDTRDLIAALEEFTAKILVLKNSILTTDKLQNQISNREQIPAVLLKKLELLAKKGDAFLDITQSDFNSFAKLHQDLEQLQTLYKNQDPLLSAEMLQTQLENALKEVQSALNQKFMDAIIDQGTRDGNEIRPLMMELVEHGKLKENNSKFFSINNNTSSQEITLNIDQQVGILWQKIPALLPTVEEIHKRIPANISNGVISENSTQKIVGLDKIIRVVNRNIGVDNLVSDYAKRLGDAFQVHKLDNGRIEKFSSLCQNLSEKNFSVFTRAFDEFLANKKNIRLLRSSHYRQQSVLDIYQNIIKEEANVFSAITQQGDKEAAGIFLQIKNYSDEMLLKILSSKDQDALLHAQQKIDHLESELLKADPTNNDLVMSLEQNISQAKQDSSNLREQFLEKARFKILQKEAMSANERSAQLATSINTYIQKNILSHSSVAARTLAYSRFLEVIDKLIENKDFNTAFVAYTSLAASHISRLEATRSGISPKHSALLLKIETLMNFEGNFFKLRSEIDKAPNATIPAVFLSKDLTPFIDANSTIQLKSDGSLANPLLSDPFFLKKLDYYERVQNSTEGTNNLNTQFLSELEDYYNPNTDEVAKLSQEHEPRDAQIKKSAISKKLKTILDPIVLDDSIRIEPQPTVAFKACSVGLVMLAAQAAYRVKKNNIINPTDNPRYADMFTTMAKHGYAISRIISPLKSGGVSDSPLSAVCMEPIDKNGPIILSFKGSRGFGDAISDIRIGLTGLPEKKYRDEAYRFYETVRNENPGREIVLTGHSLGGALAQYVAAKAYAIKENRNKVPLLHVRTFNTAPLDTKYSKKVNAEMQAQIINYRLSPDIVSRLPIRKYYGSTFDIDCPKSVFNAHGMGAVEKFLPVQIKNQVIGNTSSSNINNSLIEITRGVLSSFQCQVNGQYFSRYRIRSKDLKEMEIVFGQVIKLLEDGQKGDLKLALLMLDTLKKEKLNTNTAKGIVSKIYDQVVHNHNILLNKVNSNLEEKNNSQEIKESNLSNGDSNLQEPQLMANSELDSADKLAKYVNEAIAKMNNPSASFVENKIKVLDALVMALKDPMNARPLTKNQLSELRTGTLGRQINAFLNHNPMKIGDEDKNFNTLDGLVESLNRFIKIQTGIAEDKKVAGQIYQLAKDSFENSSEVVEYIKNINDDNDDFKVQRMLNYLSSVQAKSSHLSPNFSSKLSAIIGNAHQLLAPEIAKEKLHSQVNKNPIENKNKNENEVRIHIKARENAVTTEIVASNLKNASINPQEQIHNTYTKLFKENIYYHQELERIKNLNTSSQPLNSNSLTLKFSSREDIAKFAMNLAAQNMSFVIILKSSSQLLAQSKGDKQLLHGDGKIYNPGEVLREGPVVNKSKLENSNSFNSYKHAMSELKAVESPMDDKKNPSIPN